MSDFTLSLSTSFHASTLFPNSCLVLGLNDLTKTSYTNKDSFISRPECHSVECIPPPWPSSHLQVNQAWSIICKHTFTLTKSRIHIKFYSHKDTRHLNTIDFCNNPLEMNCNFCLSGSIKQSEKKVLDPSLHPEPQENLARSLHPS